MRRLLLSRMLTAVVLFVTPFSPAASQPAVPDVHRAATWWHGADLARRDAAIAGAIEGIQLAWMLSYARARTDDENAAAKAGGSDAVVAALAVASIREAPHYSRPLSYYRGAIDEFYARHPGGRHHSVPEILFFCLGDSPSRDCRQLYH